MIYLLTAIGLSPGGSSTVHIYTQTIHRTTQNKQYIEQHNNLGECGPYSVLARFTLAFALQLRKKHGKTSFRVGKTLSQGSLFKSERIYSNTLTKLLSSIAVMNDVLKHLTVTTLLKSFQITNLMHNSFIL